MVVLDKQLQEWNVRVVGSSDLWELESVVYRLNHTYNIYFVVKDEKGRPVEGFQGSYVTWNDPQQGLQSYPPLPTDGEGCVNYPMSQDGTNRQGPDGRWQGGPYSAFLGDGPATPKSVVVQGLGWPIALQVEFELTFRRKNVGPVFPPDDVVRAEAKKWVPDEVPGNWLFDYARKHSLGRALSKEFNFVNAGHAYRAEVFEKGVVVCEVNLWDDEHTKVYPVPR